MSEMSKIIEEKISIDLPYGIERWNRAMRGAYLKGRRARYCGEGIDCNPYQDKRKYGGQITWSRSFLICWRDGWRDMNKLLESP